MKRGQQGKEVIVTRKRGCKTISGEGRDFLKLKIKLWGSNKGRNDKVTGSLKKKFPFEGKYCFASVE